MARENHFGVKLRQERRRAGKTLEDVADFLGVSIPYVSDIERGNRAPLATEKIANLAAFLAASRDELLRAAAESRGAFELDPKHSEDHRETGAALMRGWSDLSEEDLHQIKSIVQKRIAGSR